jgi:deoxyguanosine kinase
MLIVVEGCIGAGKTTVASGLGDYRKSRVLLEAFDKNPFLVSFAHDPRRFAVETEFTFLMLHYHQLLSAHEPSTQDELIADFHLGKDPIYADLNIKEVRLRRMFRELYAVLDEQTPVIDLMICLSAPDELIVERVAMRRRPFELELDPGYYCALNHMYAEFFRNYGGQKIIVPMENWDFVKEPQKLAVLSTLVDQRLGRGNGC